LNTPQPGPHHVGPLWCPACEANLSIAQAKENDKGRAPLHNDLTVCTACLIYLRYVETMEGLTLRVVERDEFEQLPEQHQGALIQQRAHLTACGAGYVGAPPLGAILAAEIVKLKKRMARMEADQCGCRYCQGGDGLNCLRVSARRGA
jgi:hypothetical protein